MAIVMAAVVDNTAIWVAAITGVAAVIGPLTVALVQISRVARKADAIEKSQGAIQVQVNGHMSEMIRQLEEANDARLAAEVKLAVFEDRERRAAERVEDAHSEQP